MDYLQSFLILYEGKCKMGEGVKALETVSNRTNNDMVLALVVIAVVVIIIAIPIINIITKGKEKRLQQYVDREALLIQVVEKNTQVNSELKTLLETNNNNCAQCRIDHQDSLDKLAVLVTQHNEKLIEVHTQLKQSRIIED